MKFIDEVTILVASGRGGPGAVSFRREAMVARGGPDGGDGGKGGDVIFEVSPHMYSLLDHRFQKKYFAQDGEKGKGANGHGSDGKDIRILVPAGTLIKDKDGHIIKDMSEEGGEFLFLKGGLGGKGNTFYKSSIHQAPEIAQKGMPGAQAEIRLELKLLADVGLVGLPNAGKSTLISAISSARPKVADYPFTTLIPNLGVVRFAEEKSFVVADIPGLIRGAAEGTGLGTQFLRHIERTKVFIHLIDASSFASEPPLEAYKTIRDELKAHDDKKQLEEGYTPLSKRSQIVVLNKIDTVSDEDLETLIKSFRKEFGIEPLCISAAARKNLKELILEAGKYIFPS